MPFPTERQRFAFSALKAKAWGLWPAPEPFLLGIYWQAAPATFPVIVSQSLGALSREEQTPTGDKPQGRVP